jgi:hypothetical protein
MAENWRGPGTTRRDFLSLLGTALGGIALSRGSAFGGGRFGGGRSAPPPLPNGYRFFNVLTPGITDYGLSLASVYGGVMINDHGEIVFHAQDTNGAYGVYELTMDYGGDIPAVIGARSVVRQGETLPGGKVVDSIRRGATNKHGNFAAVIQTEDTPGVYLQREKKELEPIIEFLDPAPEGMGHYGAAFGDIDLHDDDDMLVVAHFVDVEHDAEIGLFHLPGSIDSDRGRAILQTGDLIPETETPIANFGIVDIDDGGEYVAQLQGHKKRKKGRKRRKKAGKRDVDRMSTSITDDDDDRDGVTAVVRGNVNAPAARAAVAATSRRMVDGAPARVRGETVFGPRVGDDDTALTIHRRDTVQVLTLNGQTITRSKARSPLGARIRAVSAPVLSPDGILYYLLITRLGLELCMSNGVDERTILARGDQIEGLPVNNILHAFHSQQADEAGRIVFAAEYEGRPNALVIGVPV